MIKVMVRHTANGVLSQQPVMMPVIPRVGEFIKLLSMADPLEVSKVVYIPGGDVTPLYEHYNSQPSMWANGPNLLVEVDTLPAAPVPDDLTCTEVRRVGGSIMRCTIPREPEHAHHYFRKI